MSKQQKVPVSERALIQRLNRKIHDEERMIRTTRGGRAESDLGRHYCLNWRGNWIVAKNIDLEDWGREHGVLKDWEELRA
jgi:hypothetical protein